MENSVSASHESHTIPFRLTVAALGPEKLPDIAATQKEIDRVLATLPETFPSPQKARRSSPRTPVKLSIISSLCEGFETLVAQRACSTCPDTLLKFVLPFAPDMNKQFFSTEDAKGEFEKLLREAKFWYPLDKKLSKTGHPQEIAPQVKDHHLKAVGRHIIARCDILLVKEDERDERISYLVQYAKSTGCPIYFLNGSRNNDLKLFQKGRPVYDHFRHFESFNKRASKVTAGQIGSDRQIKDIVEGLREAGLSGFAETIGTTVREKLAPFYLCADQLAMRYQSIYRRAGLFNFILAFMATFAIGAGVTLLHGAPLVFLIESIILVIILFLIFVANRFRSHKNYLEYRVLAEGLRTTLFFVACGIEKTPPFAERRSVQSISTWMLVAYEEILSSLPRKVDCDASLCGALGNFVLTRWIDEQREFHTKNYERNKLRAKRLERVGSAMYFVALLLAISHFVAPYIVKELHEGTLSNLLILAALMLPSAGAAVEAIRTHREIRRLRDRSKIMIHELNELRESYLVSTPEDLRRFLLRVENVMLSENQDWAQLMAAAELHPAL